MARRGPLRCLRAGPVRFRIRCCWPPRGRCDVPPRGRQDVEVNPVITVRCGDAAACDSCNPRLLCPPDDVRVQDAGAAGSGLWHPARPSIRPRNAGPAVVPSARYTRRRARRLRCPPIAIRQANNENRARTTTLSMASAIRWVPLASSVSAPNLRPGTQIEPEPAVEKQGAAQEHQPRAKLPSRRRPVLHSPTPTLPTISTEANRSCCLPAPPRKTRSCRCP